MGSIAAYAQLPPAGKIVPAGFTAALERNLGASMIIGAKKDNENFPKPHADPGIELEVSWSKNPMPNRIIEMLAAQPEDKAAQNPGSVTREEPCGRQRYHNGVLTCRKVITPWVGGGAGSALMTWRISWAGTTPTGLVGISVNRFYGTKETAMGWIDSIISKITKAK
jgi:hypothetical protein